MAKLISKTLSAYGEPNLLSLTFIDLINLKTCIGVSKKLWNPAARFFTVGFRGEYSIIDLRFTFLSLRRALLFLKLSVRQRSRIASVANSRFYGVLRKTARSRSMTIINNWISGFLTNYKNVSLHYRELKAQGGHLYGYPDVLVSFELDKKYDFIRNEARKVNLPLVSFVDSDMDFSKSLYGIIANNDSFSFLRLCFRTIITSIDFEESTIGRQFASVRKLFFSRIRTFLRKTSKRPRFKKKGKYSLKRFLLKNRKFSRDLFTIGFEPIPISYRSDFKSDASTKFRQVKRIRKRVKKLVTKRKDRVSMFKRCMKALELRIKFDKINYISKAAMRVKGLEKPSYYYYNLTEFNKLEEDDKEYFMLQKDCTTNPFTRIYFILFFPSILRPLR